MFIQCSEVNEITILSILMIESKIVFQAIEDNNKIYGFITSMANSDGKATTPMTAPSSEMQARLIESTLAKAKLAAHQIQFVEMHGMFRVFSGAGVIKYCLTDLNASLSFCTFM